eukprot:jgi/Mesvir1/6784/Mv18969-RA.1
MLAPAHPSCASDCCQLPPVPAPWQGKPRRVSGTQQNMGARKKWEEELLAALAASQSADRAKSAFLANMSHEIRTPMAGILGAGALLLETPLGCDQRELATMMVDSTQLLLSIVNDILDLSKIEEGFLKVETVPTDVNEVLAHVQELFGPKAREKGVALQVEPLAQEHGQSWIMADPTRLRQILLNLVGNAVKFTHQGQVTISAQLTPSSHACGAEWRQHHNGSNGAGCLSPVEQAAMDAGVCHDLWDLRIFVADTGIGMSPDMVARVFDRFQQAEGGAFARTYGGSGLGTTISKELAKRMGGDVTVESEQGKGSTFALRLPVIRAPATHSAPQRPSLADTPPTASSPIPCTNGEGAGRNYGFTAILAEDNHLNRRILEKVLQTVGITIIPAPNGQIVLDLVRSGVDHQLIFMDIQMPVCDGVTATKVLRAQGYHRPILALTANVMPADLASYIAAGMNGALPKPYTRAQICDEIDRLMLTHAVAGVTDELMIARALMAVGPPRAAANPVFFARSFSFERSGMPPESNPENPDRARRRSTEAWDSRLPCPALSSLCDMAPAASVIA